MTIHRAYGHVERASLAEGQPLRVVMASEGKQADGIDLRMTGVDLARFTRNPVLGYGHRYWSREDLPIGRVDNVKVQGKQLFGDLVFDPDDEFAMTCERKIRAGILSAVSIGFDVTEWENENDNYWRGGVATGWELRELSVVPVPMDASAVVTSGRSAQPGPDEFLRWVVDQWQRIYGTPPPEVPREDLKPAEPAGFVVSETAARDVLAALKT